jgi:hypothetical protein
MGGDEEGGGLLGYELKITDYGVDELIYDWTIYD